MIGWFADYGYFEREISNSTLDDFVVTDKDRPFTFATTFNYEATENYGLNLSSTSSNYDPFDAAALLETILGDDLATWYALPFWANIKPYDLNLVAPSLRLACPNLWSMFNSEPSFYYSAVYIKSLKRVLAMYNLSTGVGLLSLYMVNDDKTLTFIRLSTSGMGCPMRGVNIHGQACACFCFTGYDGTRDSLIDSTKTRCVALTKYGSKYGVHPLKPDGKNEQVESWLKAFFNDFTQPNWSDDPPPPEPDPPEGNVDTGTTLPGGYDPDSDEIPWDVGTWLSAASLGMCTVYNPTPAQVQALATRLYSKDFQAGFENYIWGNPIESIIGLSVLPCPIPSAGIATVKSWGLDTGVTMNLASNTLVHVDCGQLPVPKVYSGYLDYSPYTQAEIYIPYVGFIGLDVDDIMSQTLQLHYYIDIISGTATAKLVISNTSTTTVLGQWSCQVGRQVPVGSRDYNDIINAGIQLVAASVGAYSGSVIPEVVTDLGDALQYEGGGFNGTRFFTQMLRAGSSAIMQAKPNITRGSSIASASGQLAVQYPYLILKRPVSAKTAGYGALVGYPTFKYGTIGSYTGFVRCHNIKLDNIGCTDWELSEIFKLCCEGVYI